MSIWPSSKGKKVLRALKRIGWTEDPNDTKGSSHRQLIHPDHPTYTWAFADSDKIGPVMLAKSPRKQGCGLKISKVDHGDH